MSGEPVDPNPIFTGSQAGTSVVAWIDRVLMQLRKGNQTEALEALKGETWREPLNEPGIPDPIRRQAGVALEFASIMMVGYGSVNKAEEALLRARSRFLPGG